MQGFFITGTDTEVGKTLVSASIVAALAREQQKVVGIKPVATGGRKTKKGTRCEDAEILIKESSVELDYKLINPYCFLPPVSPHIAAAENGERIEIKTIINAVNKAAKSADWLVVEGVGGWHAPFNEQDDVATLAKELDLPVVVVVAVRLGCINHASLTLESIRASGLKVAGWVANLMDIHTQHVPDLINAVNQRAHAPMLGIFPPFKKPAPQMVVNHLNLQLLMQNCGYEIKS